MLSNADIESPVIARPLLQSVAMVQEAKQSVSNTKAQPVIRADNVNVFYDKTQALYDVSIDVEAQKITALIGPSGCGKSTLLKIIAGIEKNYQGDVVFAPNYTVGYLSQEPELDDSKTVIDIVKVTEQFANALSIPNKTIVKMRQYAWKKYRISASKYGSDWNNVFASDFNVPTLIIHDKNDREIDVSNARMLAEQWTWADYIETERLGHRRILLNPGVITSAMTFLQKHAT